MALCAPCQIMGAYYFPEVPDGSQAYTLNIHSLQLKGARICMSE